MNEDQYILFLRVLEEDEEMMRWFISLKSMPLNVRDSVLSKMVLDMRANDESANLIVVVESLKRAQIYNAISKTVGIA
jgi:hypothetical protein